MKPAPSHLDLYYEIVKLAKRGLGYEDVIVMLNIPRQPDVVDWVRRIVLGQKR